MMISNGHMITRAAGKTLRPAELIRVQQGMTRRAVAAAAGIPPHALRRIENGRRWPSPPLILRLAGALGLEVEHMALALLHGWLIEHGLAELEAQP